ncbi:MAG: hypothetical protein RIR39_1463 [Pseudomonadota bacterium]|jgi:hypothetical protein
MKQLDPLYPLTPALSRREREQDAEVISRAFLNSFNFFFKSPDFP